MCAIVDANVASAIFRPDRSDAASAFFEWINAGPGRLVVGGKLRAELGLLDSFSKWQREAILAGRVRNYSDDEVKAQTHIVKNTGLCQSDDEHIIALAQVSGARLLYSHDKRLHDDFGNSELIKKPRGKVYSTLTGPKLRDSHKQLLRKNSCRE